MKFIRNILKFIWKSVSFTRTVFFNLIFIAIIVSLFAGFEASKIEPIKQDTPLFLNPTGILVDKKTYQASPIDLLFGGQQQEAETEVREITDAIYAAAEDPRINAIVFKLDNLYGGGLSKLEEIGQALNSFKQSGKPVIAYAHTFTQQQYYLASFADEIYLHNMGNVFLTGYGMYRNYMKSAADKLSIKFHVFRVGEYKDAIENFTRNDMSIESREHNNRWVSELWSRYSNQVETARSLPNGTLEDYIDEISRPHSAPHIQSANIALKANLIDKTIDLVSLKKDLMDRFGKNKHDFFKSVNFKRYNHEIKHKNQSLTAPKVGLIVAQGNILDGYAPDSSIGSYSFMELLDIARLDHDLDALVIRVNSGGGSAFASELIREQIESIRKSGIPVYISMGSMAASGGYWLSTPATEIWATPTTITGSIGVWGLIPNFSDSLEKLGIYSDGVGTSPLSDMLYPDREMSNSAKSFFQNNVENVYARFINLVAQAREQPAQKVHQIAQGKVWTGTMAHELGLVDELGSLHELLAYIKHTHEYEQINLIDIERPLSPPELFMRSIMEEASAFFPFYEESSLELLSKVSNILPEELQLLSAQKQAHANSAPTNIFAQCFDCELAH